MQCKRVKGSPHTNPCIGSTILTTPTAVFTPTGIAVRVIYASSFAGVDYRGNRTFFCLKPTPDTEKNGTGLVFAGRALHAGLVCGRRAARQTQHGCIASLLLDFVSGRSVRSPGMEIDYRATPSSQPQLCPDISCSAPAHQFLTGKAPRIPRIARGIALSNRHL